jgi:ABC-type glycerol-3-phosphate transport system permease component
VFRSSRTLVLQQAFLLLWAVVSLLPLVWMLSASLQTNQEIYAGLKLLPASPQWSNYAQAWQMSSFGDYFINSLLYTVCAVAGTLLISSLAAFGFAWLKIPGKEIIYYAFLFLLMMPIPGQFVPLFLVLVRLGLADTRLGYILVLINASLAVSIFLLRAFMEGIPKELEEAARIDGASNLTLYWRIMLPLCGPALATITIFTALSAWNELVLALIVFSDRAKLPIQAGLMIFSGTFLTRFDLMMAATCIATLPVIIMYVVAQRAIIKGVMAGAIKG